MTRLRSLMLFASALSVGTAALVACSSSDDPRVSFVETPDATTNTPEASLPPAAPEEDGGRVEVDAGPPPKPDYDASDEAIVCATDPCATQLVAGESHFCALLSDGTVRCWGDNSRGALGTGEIDGGVDAGFAPMPVVGVSNVTQISAAEYATCARDDDGGVRCWGGNRQGQLGLRAGTALTDTVRHPTPSDVALESEVARVDVGHRSVCALDADGNAICWGGNDQRQLARPDAGTVTAGGPGPADLAGFKITRAGAGLTTAYGLTKDGRLLGWGAVAGRESSISPDPVPFPIPTLSDVTGFAVAPSHACAIAGGEVHCWGSNNKGALGTGLPDTERFPAHAPIVTDEKDVFPQQIAAAANTTCVRMTDGSIQCCGDDRLGQLGRGKAGTLTPLFGKATAFVDHAVRVVTSNLATCALVQGGKVMCWGGNANGELGQGTRDSNPHPTPVNVVFQ